MIENIRDGKPCTSFMKFGDAIRMEMLGNDEQSIFGTIEPRVVKVWLFMCFG
jgi:fumarylacetoacetate (FAA) hydrolase